MKAVFSAANFAYRHEAAFLIQMEDGLDAQHGAKQRSRAGEPAPALEVV